jgi:hypothetical protein
MIEYCNFEMRRSVLLQAKETLAAAGFEPRSSVLGGAAIAGFIAAGCSLPFDFIKTRMQEMPRNPDGSFPYKGFADCAIQTARTEGLGRFYSGFPTYCARCDLVPIHGFLQGFAGHLCEFFHPLSLNGARCPTA